VQLFDFRPRGKAAQMQSGFGVIGGVNVVADHGMRHFSFGGVGDFAGDSVKRSAADAQQYAGIRPDVQEPATNRARTGHCDVRRHQLDKLRTVTAADDADAVASPFAGFSAGRGNYPVSGGWRELDRRQHQRAKNRATSCAAQ
jgi:hypothetical protein